ncbi:MAG: ferredoxin [Actinomycetota bacterium]|nr:ferredoxin [Actinomycetota bacterium]
MRVQVDRARCEGHGVCEEIAPEIYRLDDDGVLEILLDPIPAKLEAKAESGARLCPVAALLETRE